MALAPVAACNNWHELGKYLLPVRLSLHQDQELCLTDLRSTNNRPWQ
jgi:hypothetical protein